MNPREYYARTKALRELPTLAERRVREAEIAREYLLPVVAGLHDPGPAPVVLTEAPVPPAPLVPHTPPPPEPPVLCVREYYHSTVRVLATREGLRAESGRETFGQEGPVVDDDTGAVIAHGRYSVRGYEYSPCAMPELTPEEVERGALLVTEAAEAWRSWEATRAEYEREVEARRAVIRANADTVEASREARRAWAAGLTSGERLFLLREVCGDETSLPTIARYLAHLDSGGDLDEALDEIRRLKAGMEE